MKRTAFRPIVRAACVCAASALAACATVKPASPPAPAAAAHAAPAVAAAPSAPAAPAAAALPTGPLKSVAGVVVSADSAARTLTIKDYAGHIRSFRVAAGAAVTRGGDDAEVGLEDVAAGARVRLKVGGDIAASVHVKVDPAL